MGICQQWNDSDGWTVEGNVWKRCRPLPPRITTRPRPATKAELFARLMDLMNGEGYYALSDKDLLEEVWAIRLAHGELTLAQRTKLDRVERQLQGEPTSAPPPIKLIRAAPAKRAEKPRLDWGTSISEIRATVCHRAFEIRQGGAGSISRSLSMRQAWTEIKAGVDRRIAERNDPAQQALIA